MLFTMGSDDIYYLFRDRNFVTSSLQKVDPGLLQQFKVILFIHSPHLIVPLINLSRVPCQVGTINFIKLTVNYYLHVVTNNIYRGDQMELNPRSNIIERAEFLSPETIPEKITGRAGQVKKLQCCLRPMEKGSAPVSAWLYGPPGTGKTVIACKIAEQACSSPYRVSLYVSCWQRPTLYSVVQALCEQLKILGAEA